MLISQEKSNTAAQCLMIRSSSRTWRFCTAGPPSLLLPRAEALRRAPLGQRFPWTHGHESALGGKIT
eukprot:6183531-Pleurochrysis_carterae.AAC.1